MLLVLGPTALPAQLELRVWAAPRNYRSGPLGHATDGSSITFKPGQITEYGVSLHLLRLKGLHLGVGAFGYQGAFLGEGDDAIVGFKRQVDGYAFLVPMEYHLSRFRDGATFGVALVPGVEVMSVAGDAGETRMTLAGGPTLDVAVGKRLGLRIAPEVGGFLRSPYPASELPEDTRDRTTWWLTMQFGLTYKLGHVR